MRSLVLVSLAALVLCAAVSAQDSDGSDTPPRIGRPKTDFSGQERPNSDDSAPSKKGKRLFLMIRSLERVLKNLGQADYAEESWKDCIKDTILGMKDYLEEEDDDIETQGSPPPPKPRGPRRRQQRRGRQ
ncbi:uncharacterized protein LOC101845969 [Aplysia californica]|uniref:Uncharacterized protein LOC101845969 n=1 Tax=Aplysia californica TaxID=6500 RepID=A0ABM0K965_APLCA|nr:uncharacterized protein LOC101845969 [Aplysia californica]